MVGEGIVTLGVFVVTDLRNWKSASWIGLTWRSLPVTCSTGGAKSTELPAPRNLIAMPSRTSTPSSCSRKSMWKKVRRNSPSVTPCNPHSSCARTISRIARSSTSRSAAASISPFLRRARASCSSFGRRKLPTWSPLKGGLVRWLMSESLPCSGNCLDSIRSAREFFLPGPFFETIPGLAVRRPRAARSCRGGCWIPSAPWRRRVPRTRTPGRPPA